MKYFVLAIFLKCKNARGIFLFHDFEMTLKTVSLMFSVKESFESNFEISSFFTIFGNKLFKVCAISDSDVSVFSFSVRFIFSLESDFSEGKDFTVFQNFLLSITFFSPKFW